MSFRLGLEKEFTVSDGTRYLLSSKKSTLVKNEDHALELLLTTYPLKCLRTGNLEPKKVVFEYKGF